MRYRVLAPLTMHPGAVLGLTPEQLRRRVGSCEPLGGGLVRVLRAFDLKAGEEIDCAQGLPKALAEAVAVVANEAAPAMATPPAAPDAPPVRRAPRVPRKA